MVILVIILLLALIAVGWQCRQTPAPLLHGLFIVLLLATVAGALWVWLCPRVEAARWTARANRVPEAIAFELGRAVAQAHPQGGDVLVLLPGLPAQFPMDGVGAIQVKGLKAGFGSTSLRAVPVGYTAASEEEAMQMQSDWPRSGLPLAKVSEWFAGHPGAVAVVSFVFLGTGPQGQSSAPLPPLFLDTIPVLERGPESTKAWLAQVKPGALEAVVIRRSASNWEQTIGPDSLPEAFQTCCDMVTPANIAAAQSRLIGAPP